MNVDKIVSYLFLKDRKGTPAELQKSDSAAPAPTSQSVTASAVSEEAVRVSTSPKLTKAEQPVSDDKVARLKAQVASGQYKSPGDLAAKVYAELF